MLLTRVVPLLALTLSTSARASFFGGNNQQTLVADELAVPGKNPLKFCGPPYDYILDIRQVDLTPNPPEAYVPVLSSFSLGQYHTQHRILQRIICSVLYHHILLHNTILLSS